MAKKRSSRTIVGSPLTPTMLGELGALGRLATTADTFKPDGDWINKYRIWTCHGYRERGNDNVGWLRIERTVRGPKGSFILKVRQEVVQTDRLLNVIDVAIKCLNKQPPSPVEWQLSSRFMGPDQRWKNELEVVEKGAVDRNRMTVTAAEHTLKREVPSALTSDWCLFEAVQRLDFEDKPALTFNLLEGLGVLKEDQQLLYRGGHRMKINGKDMSLHRFDQLGRGILPCEYWLDDRHRLLMVTSMNKAYILDDQAEKAIR